jgi:uncharacterized phage protein (TIGR02218 family)
MKTVVWEPSPGALVAWLLVNTQCRPFDLWTIRLADNTTVLRWNNGDTALSVNNTTWSLGPGIARTRTRQTVGVSVDTLSMTLVADATIQLGGIPLVRAIKAGRFRNATVRLDRGFFDDTFACRGIVPGFFGRVGEVTRLGRSGATIEVRSHAELLDVMIPSEVYQPGCRNTLFDAQCTLAMSTYTVTGTIATVPDTTRRTLTTGSAAVTGKPSGWADLGVITMTSGAASGQARTVRTHTLSGSAALQTVSPFDAAIAAGDTFSLRAGCDKSKATCASKFSNVVHFRGEPFVPSPETVT